MGKKSRKPKPKGNRGHRPIPGEAVNTVFGQDLAAVISPDERVIASGAERLAPAGLTKRPPRDPEPIFHIVVKDLTGKTWTIAVSGSAIIYDVKDKLQDKLGGPPATQHLLYKQRVLKDDRTLDSYEIQDNSILLVVHKFGGTWVAAEAKTPAPLLALSIYIRNQSGDITQFKVTSTVKLGKLFNAYATLNGIALTSICFLSDGLRIRGDQTPEDIDMEDGDVIDCVAVEDLQAHKAHRIVVAAAVAKAAAKALPPHETWGNPRFFRALDALHDETIIDKDDKYDFDEYWESLRKCRRVLGNVDYVLPKEQVRSMVRWVCPRNYWPRIRRRICSNCGKHSYDLSQPRLLVCDACGEGRYCSEGCQREHWAATHQKDCIGILREKMQGLRAAGWKPVGPVGVNTRSTATMMIDSVTKETMTLARAMTRVPLSPFNLV